MIEQGNIKQKTERVENAAFSVTGNATYICNYYYFNNIANDVVSSADAQLSDASSDDKFVCPYRGLLHFDYNVAEFFFGREVFVQQLVEVAENRSFIPILGSSGSGKSSVVLAGLVPQLHQQGNWLFTHFRPGSESYKFDPFYELAQALVPLYKSEQDSTDEIIQANKLAQALKEGQPLYHVFSQIERKHPNYRLLLIADQFEQLYTLSDDEATRKHFLDCLLKVIEPSSSKSPFAVLVATIRADFLEKALSYRPFADVLQNDIKLAPMNCEELKQVIEKPAQKLGVTFENGLVERILKDVNEQPGNLPLLEFALMELWKCRKGRQLTHVAYEEIGQVQGALASYADKVYNKLLKDAKEEQIKRIFIQLVRPGEGTKDTRRVATKSEIGEDNWFLVQHLANHRLVVINQVEIDQNIVKQVTVEVAHEALIGHWHRLRAWIDGSRSKIIQKNRIERLANEWDNNKRTKDYFLKGRLLKDAKEWKTQQTTELTLSTIALEFIQASSKQRRNELCIILSLFLVLVVFVGISYRKQINTWLEIRQLIEIFQTAQKQQNSSKEKQALEGLVKHGVSLANFQLSGDELGRIKLSGADLRGVNLSRAKLGGAILSGANLSGANLSGANLGAANLSGANLSGANLSGANLGDANLGDANLSDVDLGGAKLGGAILWSADLSHAKLNSADLGGSDLGGANLVGANLVGAKLNNYANLGYAKLNDADLTGADFTNAQNLVPNQVKVARNCQQARYSMGFSIPLCRKFSQ
jgi:uncharacterized protein YjbI with pentapeptide repeats/predicted Zn-dependent protease with MMP-like domain